MTQASLTQHPNEQSLSLSLVAIERESPDERKVVVTDPQQLFNGSSERFHNLLIRSPVEVPSGDSVRVSAPSLEDFNKSLCVLSAFGKVKEFRVLSVCISSQWNKN